MGLLSLPSYDSCLKWRSAVVRTTCSHAVGIRHETIPMDEPAGHGPVLVQMHRQPREPCGPLPVFPLTEKQLVG